MMQKMVIYGFLDVNLKLKDHILNDSKNISKFIPLIYRIGM